MSDYFDRVERQIVHNVEAGLPRGSFLPVALRYVAGTAAVAVVIAVVAVFLIAGGSGSKPTATPATGHTITVRFAASTVDPHAQLGPAIDRSIPILRERLHSVFPDVAVSRAGGDILVTTSNANADTRARILALVGTTAQLAFYDWEANVIAPNGKTVASQLAAQDPAAIEISQGGGGNAVPGQPGAGSLNLYDAVRLASKQPERSSAANSRLGPQYWMFGAPGGTACAAAAKANGTVPAAGQHCLLSGPNDDKANLLAALPAGVSASEGEIVTVPRGTVVLQAVPADFSKPTPIGDPSAQFFVLRDDVAIRGSEITDPQQSTDLARQPDVTFGFTHKGRSEFEDVTANVARRGELVSGLGQQFNQHFAVALDSRLITVPYISYKQYPDGINGDNGADISGSFTVTSAQDLANQLRLSALPVRLATTG
jgi:SecD/SecF fusion protein